MVLSWLMVHSMPWVKPTDRYLSDAMPRWGRWPLSRVFRYLFTFTAGVLAGVALAPAGRLEEPRGVVAVPEVVPAMFGVQRVGVVMRKERVIALASPHEADKAATVRANRGSQVRGARRARGGDE